MLPATPRRGPPYRPQSRVGRRPGLPPAQRAAPQTNWAAKIHPWRGTARPYPCAPRQNYPSLRLSSWQGTGGINQLTGADQHQPGVGHAAADPGKNAQQPGMAFLLTKRPHAKQNSPSCTSSSARRAVRAAGSWRANTSVIMPLGSTVNGCLPYSISGALAAGKAVGQVVVKAGTHQPVQLAHQVVLIGSVVAVACPHRHPAAAGHGIIKHAKAAVMPVDDLVFRVRGKKGAQVMQVFRDIIVLPHRQLGNVPAQGFNFSIIKQGLS